jgi:hypothetical protein
MIAAGVPIELRRPSRREGRLQDRAVVGADELLSNRTDHCLP